MNIYKFDIIDEYQKGINVNEKNEKQEGTIKYHDEDEDEDK